MYYSNVVPNSTGIVHDLKVVMGHFAIEPIVVAKRGRTVGAQVDLSEHIGFHAKIIFSDSVVVLISVKLYVVNVCAN